MDPNFKDKDEKSLKNKFILYETELKNGKLQIKIPQNILDFEAERIKKFIDKVKDKGFIDFEDKDITLN